MYYIYILIIYILYHYYIYIYLSLSLSSISLLYSHDINNQPPATYSYGNHHVFYAKPQSYISRGRPYPEASWRKRRWLWAFGDHDALEPLVQLGPTAAARCNEISGVHVVPLENGDNIVNIIRKARCQVPPLSSTFHVSGNAVFLLNSV